MSEQPIAGFRLHDLWLSPRHYYYRVVEIGATGQAVLRLGHLGTGRRVFRSFPKRGWRLAHRAGVGCQHPVTHTNPDGSVVCLVCDAVIQQAKEAE